MQPFQSVGFILWGPWVDHNSKKYLNLDQSNGQKNVFHQPLTCSLYFLFCHAYPVSYLEVVIDIEYKGFNVKDWGRFKWTDLALMLKSLQHIKSLSDDSFFLLFLERSPDVQFWALLLNVQLQTQYILNVKDVSTLIDRWPGVYSSTNVRKHNFGTDPPKQLLCEKYQSL